MVPPPASIAGVFPSGTSPESSASRTGFQVEVFIPPGEAKCMSVSCHVNLVHEECDRLDRLYIHDTKEVSKSNFRQYKNRWKRKAGKSQRGEEQKMVDQRRERVRRKTMQVREKVEKSRFISFFSDLWLWRVAK